MTNGPITQIAVISRDDSDPDHIADRLTLVDDQGNPIDLTDNSDLETVLTLAPYISGGKLLSTAISGAASSGDVSPDGSYGLPVPTGAGFEKVFINNELDHFAMNGVEL